MSPNGTVLPHHLGKALVCPKCQKELTKNEEAKFHLIEEFPSLAVDEKWKEFFHHCNAPCKYYSIQKSNYLAHLRVKHHRGSVGMALGRGPKDKYVSQDCNGTSTLTPATTPLGNDGPSDFPGQRYYPPKAPDVSAFVPMNARISHEMQGANSIPVRPPLSQENLLGLSLDLPMEAMAQSNVCQPVGGYEESYAPSDHNRFAALDALSLQDVPPTHYGYSVNPSEGSALTGDQHIYSDAGYDRNYGTGYSRAEPTIVTGSGRNHIQDLVSLFESMRFSDWSNQNMSLNPQGAEGRNNLFYQGTVDAAHNGRAVYTNAYGAYSQQRSAIKDACLTGFSQMPADDFGWWDTTLENGLWHPVGAWPD